MHRTGKAWRHKPTKEIALRRSRSSNGFLLVPALVWLFIQFAMSGIMLGSSADAMQVEICTPFGVQQIAIDPATGEPVEQANQGQCDWCQSFGAMVDIESRTHVAWSWVQRDFSHLSAIEPQPHVSLFPVATFQSRAPPMSPHTPI